MIKYRCLADSLVKLFACMPMLIWVFVVIFGQSSRSSDAVHAGDKIQLVSRLSKAAPADNANPASDAIPYPYPAEMADVDLLKQSLEQSVAKSHGCVKCHQDACDPHEQPDRPLSFHLGCVDCHGGNSDATCKEDAHVQPRYPQLWHSSGNPARSYTLLNYECPEFVRFVNPGDLRIAHLSCGTAGCHTHETLEVRKSMMTHGCMLWGAALYNNGAVPNKWPRYGESYAMNGTPQRLQTVPAPTAEEMAKKGILPFLDPLPRFENSQPGNVLRIFERGGRFAPADVGNPETLEINGQPRQRLSNRGLGTANRTDPVFIGLQKTRLFDPTLNFLGTNDHAGDFRSSGCSSCHMVYANDRSPVNAGPWAKYGNDGTAHHSIDDLVHRIDPTIPKDERGHPVTHRFVTGVPTSQCIVCHIHPGTTVMNSYLGFMWWDQETDGEFMYPKTERKPTSEEFTQAQMNDPNEIAARSNCADPNFLQSLSALNPSLRKSYFADFHGHGWVFKAVFKKDREGHYLDHFGNQIPDPTAEIRQASIDQTMQSRDLHRNRDQRTLSEIQELEAALRQSQKGLPVHLLDVHLEKGMHCVDCHFVQDVHGNTKLYGEVRAAIEIQCEDCHGSTTQKAVRMVNGIPKMYTSGPAAEEHPQRSIPGRDLTQMRTPFGKRRFEVRGNHVVQNSMVEKDLSWEIKQVVDTINPRHRDYNALSALAKTVRFDATGEFAWGDLPESPDQCPHSPAKMNCVACHSAWNPSCYGCHLPQKANKKAPGLHNEGDVTRNYVSYNFQTLREDIYMLAHDGNVTKNRIGPARSSCAIHVTSYNGNREGIYNQQQTISAEGMSGIAFSTNVPHTVRGRGETKSCGECHLTPDNRNNTQMAQVLMQGTNFMNFIGRFCWVGAGAQGIHGVEVTERDEPQTVIGSSMHKLVYPNRYRNHCENETLLTAARHPGKDIGDNILHPLKKPEILSLLARGEYLYTACGEGGVRVFDIAFIDNKGFSQRFSTAPVSPLGQRFYVRTKYATSVAAPTTIAPDPTRTHRPENHEASVHALYGYIYATDLYDGLVLIAAGTLLDGNPANNFLEPSVVYNPQGQLNGARAVTIAGNYAYVSCTAGLVVVDINDPKHPCIVSTIGSDLLNCPTAVQIQFRYGFVCDKEGLKVLDVTDLAHPHIVACHVLQDARNVYVARNLAYVAAGCEGLAIVDVTNPEAPVMHSVFNANGQLNDVSDVKLGAYYASQFAFVADGRNGMRVLQLTSPETPGYDSFLPQPDPVLIATYKIPHGGSALAISEGVDRDRAVDESGNQIAVFGRVGAGPLSLDEQRRMYLKRDGFTPYRTPEIQRNEEIDDPRKREIDLHYRLEGSYGTSRFPLSSSTQRVQK